MQNTSFPPRKIFSFFFLLSILENQVGNSFFIISTVIYPSYLEIRIMFSILIKTASHNYEAGMLVNAVILCGRKYLKD